MIEQTRLDSTSGSRIEFLIIFKKIPYNLSGFSTYNHGEKDKTYKSKPCS